MGDSNADDFDNLVKQYRGLESTQNNVFVHYEATRSKESQVDDALSPRYLRSTVKGAPSAPRVMRSTMSKQDIHATPDVFVYKRSDTSAVSVEATSASAGARKRGKTFEAETTAVDAASKVSTEGHVYQVDKMYETNSGSNAATDSRVKRTYAGVKIDVKKKETVPQKTAQKLESLPEEKFNQEKKVHTDQVSPPSERSLGSSSPPRNIQATERPAFDPSSFDPSQQAEVREKYIKFVHDRAEQHSLKAGNPQDVVHPTDIIEEDIAFSVNKLKALFGGQLLEIVDQMKNNPGARDRLEEMTGPKKTAADICASMLKNDEMSIEETFGKPNDACQGFFQRFVNRPIFGVTVGLIICINVVTIGLSVDAKTQAPETEETYLYLETAFNIFFIFEMVCRLSAFRFKFFKDSWSNLDLLIVILSCTDNFVITPMLKDDSSATSVGNNQTLAGAGAEAGLVASLSTLSLLRLLRLTRIVVSVRLFGIFEPLNVLLKGLYNSVKSVIWVMFLQVFVLFMFGTAFTILIAHDPRFEQERLELNAQNSELSLEEFEILAEQVFEWFGTIPRSMFTLFQCMTFDGWSDIARATNKEMPEMMILYVMFLVSSGFALFSLLTGVLVDHVNLASQSARAQSEAKTQYLPHVYKVMKLIDTDGTGSITFPELQEAMKNPAFTKFLEIFGVGTDAAEDLFKYFDFDNDGIIQYWEFIQEFLAVRHAATRGDLFRLRAAVCRALADRTEAATASINDHQIKYLEKNLSNRLDIMQSDLARLQAASSQMLVMANQEQNRKRSSGVHTTSNTTGLALQNVTDVTTRSRNSNFDQS